MNRAIFSVSEAIGSLVNKCHVDQSRHRVGSKAGHGGGLSQREHMVRGHIAGPTRCLARCYETALVAIGFPNRCLTEVPGLAKAKIRPCALPPAGLRNG